MGDIEKKKGFEALGKIMPNVIASLRNRPEENLIEIWDIWNHVVGEGVAENAQPSAFKGKLLLVEVNSSVWMHHLQFLKDNFIERINETLGKGTVEDIKFKIGTLDSG